MLEIVATMYPGEQTCQFQKKGKNLGRYNGHSLLFFYFKQSSVLKLNFTRLQVDDSL
jgi:hypothetical protein